MVEFHVQDRCLRSKVVCREARRRCAERKRCSEMQLDWLQFFWQIVYVTNFASAYLTYDFARSYLDAGGFHIRRNLWLAWLTVKDWYSWAAVICLIPIALIAYFSGGLFDLNL